MDEQPTEEPEGRPERAEKAASLFEVDHDEAVKLLHEITRKVQADLDAMAPEERDKLQRLAEQIGPRMQGGY